MKNIGKLIGLCLLLPLTGLAEPADITVDVVSKMDFVIFFLKNYEDKDFQCSYIRVQAKVTDKGDRVALRSIITRNVILPRDSLEIKLEAGKEIVEALRNEMNQPRIVEVSDLKYRCKPKKIFQDRLKNGSLGPKMVWIPAGSFRMGNLEEKEDYRGEGPVHSVFIKRFAMGMYEVTVGEFRQFVNATGYKTDAEKIGFCNTDHEMWFAKGSNWRNPHFSQDSPYFSNKINPPDSNHPVVCVSWNDAMAYVKWLTQQTGYNYRLPTEAEWEYATRAGTTTKYWWGNEIGSNEANCAYHCGDRFKETAPVGSFQPNSFGLFDTAGNVYEWVADYYHDNYKGAPTDGSKWAKISKFMVLRGGSWNRTSFYSRSSHRTYKWPDYSFIDIGFRVVVDTQTQ